MTDTVEVPRELLERACLNLDAVAYYQFGAPLTPDDATRRGIADELRALLTKPASVPDEVPVLGGALSSLLPALDDALEDLEIHGRHSDRGYVKLKAWYGAMRKATNAIEAAMAAQEDAQ